LWHSAAIWIEWSAGQTIRGGNSLNGGLSAHD
jgi:hypothetical protein